MIRSAEPCAVYLPKLFNASGQIAGHTNALAKPSNAIQATELGSKGAPSQPHNICEIPVSVFELNNTQVVSIKPNTAELNNAVCCEIKRGIHNKPMA